MSHIQKILVAALFILLIVEVVIIAPKKLGSREELSSAKMALNQNESEQVLHGLKLTETSEGSKEWELDADRAMSYKADASWKLEKVSAVFYGKNNVTYHVTGETGMIMSQSKSMKIQGNVYVKSSNGYEFKTEEVNYQSESKKLDSAVAVNMLGPTEKNGNRVALNGVGMQANLATNEIKILNQVNGSKNLEDGRKVVIKSGSALFNGADKSAKFLDTVVVDMGGARLTGPSARFDFDAKNDIVKSMTIGGGVQISDAEKWATAENVVMQFATDNYILTGSPRVVQSGGELVGDEIVFVKGGKEIRVNKGKARIENGQFGERF